MFCRNWRMQPTSAFIYPASRLAAETARIVGAVLYQRTSRGIELTAAGEAFARRAQRMLLEIDETPSPIVIPETDAPITESLPSSVAPTSAQRSTGATGPASPWSFQRVIKAAAALPVRGEWSSSNRSHQGL